MDGKMRGITEMTLAMVISGTIGWFVLMSGRPVLDVVFWRCVFGALALLSSVPRWACFVTASPGGNLASLYSAASP
jgi:hypothetical protein